MKVGSKRKGQTDLVTPVEKAAAPRSAYSHGAYPSNPGKLCTTSPATQYTTASNV
jgi:hypothetical protein